MTLFFLAPYLAGMLAIGLASRRIASRSEASYYVADRAFGSWRGFAALAATTTGGSTTIVCAALVYRHGLAGIWLDLAGALGLFALGLLLAGRVRETGAMTLPEIAGRFYGQTARRVSGVLVLLAEIAWFALLTEASQTVLTAAFGVRETPALLASAAVFIAYTSLGGQYAVIRTDLVKYSLMVAGILLVGGGSAFLRFGGRLHFPPQALAFPVSATLPWGAVLTWLLLVGLPHLVGSDVYAKILSCRDERAARNAAWGAAASKVVFGVAVAALALCVRQTAPPLDFPEQALPRALLGFPPPLLASLALVALLAAMHSSADSVLLSAASVTVRDVLPSLLNRRPGFRLARILVPIYGVFGLLVALRMRQLVETLKLGYSLFTASMILPILFGFFRRLWLPPADAIAAMVAGGTLALAGSLLPAGTLRADPVVAGTGVNLLILLLAILRTRLAGRCPGDYRR
jgi:SSS family solute:Na+ symporter